MSNGLQSVVREGPGQSSQFLSAPAQASGNGNVPLDYRSTYGALIQQIQLLTYSYQWQYSYNQTSYVLQDILLNISVTEYHFNLYKSMFAGTEIDGSLCSLL